MMENLKNQFSVKNIIFWRENSNETFFSNFYPLCIFLFQCSTVSSGTNQTICSSPKIEHESILSGNSREKLLDNNPSGSQNSIVLHRSSTATSTSLVLNNEDESLMNNEPDVILQQHPQGNYTMMQNIFFG